MQGFARIGLMMAASVIILAFCSPGFCGEFANLESSPNMPLLWGLHDQGEIYWGRWFTEITLLPCNGSEPERCDEMRVAISPQYEDEDNPDHPVFFTERAERWSILGYHGHLNRHEEGEPLVVSMLRHSDRRTPRYSICQAKVGFSSAHIECFPREEGAEVRLEFALPTVEFDLAASVGMDRLLALTDAPLPLAIYQEAAVRVAEAPFDINLIRAAPENGMPTLCAVRMDMS